MSNKNVSIQGSMLLISNDHQWYEKLRHALHSFKPISIVEYKEEGSKAIKRKLQRSQKYEIIIIDVGTVGAKSADLVKQLRDLRHETKVVVASAAPTWRQAKEAFDMGALDYIRKSLNEKELFSTFEEILRKKLPLSHQNDLLGMKNQRQ